MRVCHFLAMVAVAAAVAAAGRERESSKINHPVSMVEQQFRKQGLPVKIHNGKIVLLDGKQEYRLCKVGETLSPEKCKTLTHFGIKLSEFRVKLVCHWSKDGGFEKLT